MSIQRLIKWFSFRALKYRQLNNIEYCLEAIKLIKGKDLKQIPLEKKQTYILETTFKNIGELNRILKETHYEIKNNSVLSQYNGQMTFKSLDNFFVDEENCYVDVEEAFNTFSTHLLNILSLLEKNNSVGAGYPAYATRMTKILIHDIAMLLKKLSTLVE